MTTEQGARRDPEPSGWAMGGLAFAATVMMIVGIFQIIAGLVAIFDDEFFVVTQNYTFDIDTSVWGWVHLLIGLLMAGAGFSLFGRGTYGGVMAIFLCGISAVVNFFFIPYYPFWSLLVIALDIWVIWAVTRPGAIRT